MSKNINLTDVAAFQAYVQEYYDMLLTKLYFALDSTQYFTVHEGVKGRIALTNLVVEDLVRRYSSTFTSVDNTHKFTPRNLQVVDAKVDMVIIPKDFESTYLGQFRKKGQDSYDLPFAGYILDATLKKVAAEIEVAIHRAVPAGSPAATDKLIALFKGLNQIVIDEVAALAPVTTGNLTAANAFSNIEKCFMEVPSQYQNSGIEVFISPRTNL